MWRVLNGWSSESRRPLKPVVRPLTSKVRLTFYITPYHQSDFRDLASGSLRPSANQPLRTLHVSSGLQGISLSYMEDLSLHPTDDTSIELYLRHPEPSGSRLYYRLPSRSIKNRMPLNFLGIGAGGGCGVGLGLGWGFGTAFGSQYRSSRVIFQGVEFTNQSQTDSKESTNSSRISQKVHGGQ